MHGVSKSSSHSAQFLPTFRLNCSFSEPHTQPAVTALLSHLLSSCAPSHNSFPASIAAFLFLKCAVWPASGPLHVHSFHWKHFPSYSSSPASFPLLRSQLFHTSGVCPQRGYGNRGLFPFPFASCHEVSPSSQAQSHRGKQSWTGASKTFSHNRPFLFMRTPPQAFHYSDGKLIFPPPMTNCSPFCPHGCQETPSLLCSVYEKVGGHPVVKMKQPHS
jgi:hypothetical protein